MRPASSHELRKATRIPSRQKRTVRRRFTAALAAAASISASEVPGLKVAVEMLTMASVISLSSRCRTGIAGLDLFFEIGPDGARIVDEALLVADVGDDARARQGDRVDGFHRRRPGSEHIDLVGQRDRFLEIV